MLLFADVSEESATKLKNNITQKKERKTQKKRKDQGRGIIWGRIKQKLLVMTKLYY